VCPQCSLRSSCPSAATRCSTRYIHGVQVGVLGPGIGRFNVIGTFHVKVLPLKVTVAAAALIEHWLFCNVAADPRAAACHAVPLSPSKLIW